MLAAAEQGVVHRDLKPSNILIDGQRRARVADFGLARSVGSFAELTATGTGAMLGTPYYMAPEQAEDPRGVDTRADVYSFGATFYHALTGVPPFDGATAFTILYKHKTEPLTAPRSRNQALSARTGELIERCLAKSPADRFPTFGDILKQLAPQTDAPAPWDDWEEPELNSVLAKYHARRDLYFNDREALDTGGDVYSFPSGRVVRILFGDMVEQSVDAVVSSDNSMLTMDTGVSYAIAQRGGPRIKRETEKFDQIRTGRVVVTSAGDLPARFVFHAVTVGYEPGRAFRSSRDIISELMASCFYHAETVQIRSIAFPLLGTGGAGFDRAVCLDTMFRYLARTFLRGATPVREARIVLWLPPREWHASD
jgi:O-acetyl-ADP-ribose deacetylase (regulator of RNase III)